jgi:transposase
MVGNYNKSIIKQLEDLIVENERLSNDNAKLREENRELRAENTRLRKRIEELETTIEDRIEKAVKEAVKQAVEPLYAIITEKDKEILRLKSQINKDSSNSSKPPSSNGFKNIPNNREKSDKKQGGQVGHKGFRLNVPKDLKELVASGRAEHIIISDVSEDEEYVSDWTIDLKVVVVYIEHRRKPNRPPKIEYGLQLKAIAVYLSVMGLIAFKRLSQFFCEISDNLITVSKASLGEFIREVSDRIDLEEYIKDLLNGKVIHVDETPVKTSERQDSAGKLETAEKTTFSVYIRTYSNGTTTILTANSHKTEESVRGDNILTRFHGIISQDHESKFYNLGYLHATCGVHLTRELKGLSEFQMLEWGEEMRQFFLEMNKHKNEDICREKTYCEPSLLSLFESRYDELLESGRLQLGIMSKKSFGYKKFSNMLKRLKNYKDNYLLFIRNYEAPFSNNQAERDLRHCKTRQKVSGCFRSWQGVLDYCKIRSLLGTAKKRGKNMLLALSSIFSQPQLCTGGQ